MATRAGGHLGLAPAFHEYVLKRSFYIPVSENVYVLRNAMQGRYFFYSAYLYLISYLLILF